MTCSCPRPQAGWCWGQPEAQGKGAVSLAFSVSGSSMGRVGRQALALHLILTSRLGDLPVLPAKLCLPSSPPFILSFS